MTPGELEAVLLRLRLWALYYLKSLFNDLCEKVQVIPV